MKVHILTSCFYPELHPRAFRAFELAREMARQGDEVCVTALTQVEGVDYQAMQAKYGFTVRFVALYQRQLGQHEQTGVHFESNNRLAQALYTGYRKTLEYFIAGNLLLYAPRIAKQLDIAPDTDMFIALSTPFMDIMAGALYHRKHANTTTLFIADSGDPFSGSKQTKRAIYMRWLERWVYRYYDYLTIPTANAIPAYRQVIETEKIRIIPQGFDFKETPIAEYKKNSVPTFAYAGVFYQDIRNPEFLLQYLAKRQHKFLFRIYLRHKDAYTETLLSKYKPQIGECLDVQYGVERTDLIYQLSQCDFLINIGNNNTTQLPSKLIDYGITKRPVFHCTEHDFDASMLKQFMQGDYSQYQPIDISRYAIQNIADGFKSLALTRTIHL